MIFGKRGTKPTPVARPIKEVLRDRSGSGVAQELGGIALVVIATSMVAVGVSTDTKAVQTFSVKAERQALVASLADDKRPGASWGTPTAPITQTVTLENGANVPVTLWREASPVGTTLTAVTPISAGPDAANCTTPADVEKQGCLYAQRFHVADINSVDPDVIIRKDPTSAPGAVVGTVDSRVSTAASVPQGATFATGTDATATSWRYLVTARSLEVAGEIRFTQAGKILAVVPVAQAINNYFGTFSAAPGVPVTATVTQGNVVVQTVLTYRAGGN